MNAPASPHSVLITNDDGIRSEGLRALCNALYADGHRVVIVSPEHERSAVGHGLTLHKPLRAYRTTIAACQGWAITGTPADCVKLALAELLDSQPDMVVSGINLGANVGVNLNYSGTVAAAREAALYGIKAMAVSVAFSDDPPYEAAARTAADLVALVLTQGLPPHTFLNLNIPGTPSNPAKEIRIGHQGVDVYDDYFEKRRDPRNGVYYWHGSESSSGVTSGDTDNALFNAGYTILTPLRCDATDYELLDQMKRWPLTSPGEVEL